MIAGGGALISGQEFLRPGMNSVGDKKAS